MTDLLFFNGKLWTQDPRFPDATAVAVQAGRILAVGSDAEMLALAGPGTQAIDLGGRRVLPGLTDAHFHFQGWAMARRNLQLAGLPSLQAAQQALSGAVQTASPGRWIRGQGWNETDWTEPRLLTRHDLDAVAPNHPVVLWRSDLHLATANTLALRLAGITGDTPDPAAGVIDRDAAGQPTGVLRDQALEFVDAVLPQPGEAEIDAAMRDAIVEAHRLGLTGVHDFRIGDAAESQGAFQTWQRLHAAGDLKLRVWMMIDGRLLEEAIRLGLRSGFGDDRLRIGGVKYFADGSLGARTASMLAPYNDGGSGLPVVPMAELATAIEAGAAAGLPVGIHAIGDRAIRELLDVFSEVLPKVARSAPPGGFAQTGHSDGLVNHSPFPILHRIEHVQHSHPDDLRRLGSLGLVASVQPIHLVDDMALVERAVGERGRWAYALRTLLDSGAVLALGSDCPVASPNPFWGIHAAVTRQRRDGTPAGGWYPEERLTVAEAVAGYTSGPAYASGQIGRLGSISPGKLADLVVLDRDIFAVPPSEIADTQAVLTVFDGAVVYSNKLLP
ncbi:MAG TPA: amidohydrolase [Anaerolineae bacterium]|nr:amidohydrolase [Anaerolineae bacterium]